MQLIYAEIYLFIHRTEAGKHLAPAVTVGDRVLLPEFGGAKVTYTVLTCFLGDSSLLPTLFIWNRGKITERVW
jgi:hypothetical protein